MPAQTTELRVRDVRIKLHRAGNGPTVLFLHGAGGVPQWLPFFDVLAEQYEVLVPEHPGFGGSDDPPWIRSVADLALFYLDLVEEAGLDRIHLVGNSLGGWLAAEILIRDRARFRSLVQLAPAGRGGMADIPRMSGTRRRCRAMSALSSREWHDEARNLSPDAVPAARPRRGGKASLALGGAAEPPLRSGQGRRGIRPPYRR